MQADGLLLRQGRDQSAPSCRRCKYQPGHGSARRHKPGARAAKPRRLEDWYAFTGPRRVNQKAPPLVCCSLYVLMFFISLERFIKLRWEKLAPHKRFATRNELRAAIATNSPTRVLGA